MQSRGVPIAPPDDERLKPFRDAGRAPFDRRQGQLNLACSHCHDDNWGKRLAGNLIPQAHPNGYPLYRLEWQSVGSLQRRLRNCLIGMRAEPYDYGAAGVCRSGAVPDVARPRHADGSAGGAALN